MLGFGGVFLSLQQAAGVSTGEIPRRQHMAVTGTFGQRRLWLHLGTGEVVLASAASPALGHVIAPSLLHFLFSIA